MPESLVIGSIRSAPGKIVRGNWEAFDHPTGLREFLPVILAQGREDGPCLVLSAGLHGPEHSGPMVLYRLLSDDLVRRMRGTIIALPALSPAGLRTMSREPYHDGQDPNRLWPEGKPAARPDPDVEPPTPLEAAFGRLFGEVIPHASGWIDFHNAWIGSIPFALRDRVLYRETGDVEAQRHEAMRLGERLTEMSRALGFTTVNEFPSEKYTSEKLHRSTSGAALLAGRIPALTVELGSGPVPDTAIAAAAVVATRNVMRWAGMLSDPPEPVQGIPVVDPGYPVRRRNAPRVPSACVALPRVEAGDSVRPGDAIADLYDIWGRTLDPPVLQCGDEGFVLGRRHGIYFYPGQAVTVLAIRDELPLVAPYPKDFETPST
jgi:predicted deacylase